MAHDPKRHFLFLQGPHGPFFATMARQVQAAGHCTSRIGFNAGDAMFRRRFGVFTRYCGSSADWPAWLAQYCETHRVTDVILYGTTRPVHAEALKLAKGKGIKTHIFEEGYLRPWWVTYERSGSNATSRLMATSLEEMREALAGHTAPPSPAPARWGDTRQHVFWGAVYHGVVLAGSLRRAPFPTHREPGVSAEVAIALRHLILSPYAALARARATARIARSGAPYHLVLLQLAHDANYRAASPYATTEDYLADVISSFADGALGHHHLVFKAHPLEDGRQPLRRLIHRLAAKHGVAHRVHFLSGAKLAPLLDGAHSAVTVNSTAAHQALWRGLPMKTLGLAPHAKPGLSSNAELKDFFRAPTPPDRDAYMTFRTFLLATCQIPGGFYAAKARQRLLKWAVDAILSENDPFDAPKGADASAQQLQSDTFTAR